MTDIATATREEISTAWPAVTYNGKDDFFDRYIGMIDQLQPQGDCDSQECYLGYIPSTDTFVMGFDVWPDDDEYFDEEEDIDNVFMFKMDGNNAVDVRPVAVSRYMFYSGGCYQEVRQAFPDIIDLRLD